MLTGAEPAAAALSSGPVAAEPTRPVHTILVLVDGVGLPQGVPLAQTVYRYAPALLELIESHSVPLDATLGWPGIPQSATGQTAILTGVNGAALLREHLQGFPNAALRQVIQEKNVFTQLLAAGRTCTFANAYARAPGTELPLYLRSVTTVATLAAFGATRNRDSLLAHDAVFHDLTRTTLRESGFIDIPEIAEAEAADDLLQIARTTDLCLFEYFLTDHAAHRGRPEDQQRVIASLGRFLGRLQQGLDPTRELLLLVSDHGNIEQPDCRGHTTNPVPWIAYGCAARRALVGVHSILDVTPAILRLLTGSGPNEAKLDER